MRGRGWRLVLGCAVVAAQPGWIAFAQSQPWRWFAWARNDYVTRYSVETLADGRTLTADELCDRYGREFCPEDDEAEEAGGPPRYVDEGPAEHILSEIRSYESNHGNGEARVTVRYRSTSFKGERPSPEPADRQPSRLWRAVANPAVYLGFAFVAALPQPECRWIGIVAYGVLGAVALDHWRRRRQSGATAGPAGPPPPRPAPSPSGAG